MTCVLANANEGESEPNKIDGGEIQNLIRLLSDDTYSTRERASNRLLELGEQVIPVLTAARDSISDQPEVVARLRFLVRTIHIKATYQRLVAPSIKWEKETEVSVREAVKEVESQLQGSVQVLDPRVLDLRLPMIRENTLGPLLARICNLGGLWPTFPRIPCEGGKDFLLVPSCGRQNVTGSEYVLVAACVSERIGQRRWLDFRVLPFCPSSGGIVVSRFTIEYKEGQHDVVDAAVPLAKLQEKLKEIGIDNHEFRIKYSIELPVPSDVDLFQIEDNVGSKGQIRMPNGWLTYQSKTEGTNWDEEVNPLSPERSIWGFVCQINDSGVSNFQWSNGLSGGDGNGGVRSSNFLPRRYPSDVILFYGRPKGIHMISLSESISFQPARDLKPVLDQPPAPPVEEHRPAPKSPTK